MTPRPAARCVQLDLIEQGQIGELCITKPLHQSKLRANAKKLQLAKDNAPPEKAAPQSESTPDITRSSQVAVSVEGWLEQPSLSKYMEPIKEAGAGKPCFPEGQSGCEHRILSSPTANPVCTGYDSIQFLLDVGGLAVRMSIRSFPCAFQ